MNEMKMISDNNDGMFDVNKPSCSDEQEEEECVDDVLDDDDDDDDALSFKYEWIVKIRQRSTGSEAVILNISPAFSTALNGVQFTWTLRVNDDCIVSDCVDNNCNNGCNIFLYYKDGPKQDVNIIDAMINVIDSKGEEIFKNLAVAENEFTIGSGWALRSSELEEMQKLNSFMQNNIGNAIRISVTIRMDAKIFSPLCYLTNNSVSTNNRSIEEECRKYLKEVENGLVMVPDLDLIIDDHVDMYAIHRRIITHGCEEVERRLAGLSDGKQILNVFAHIYFTECIMPEVECFEEFLEVIEGAHTNHIPTLIREAERFICREMIVCFDESDFAKKMLLIAQHYQLAVLKMICIGILSDCIIEASNKVERINSIGNDMRKIVRQITLSDEQHTSDEQNENETLVDSVVEELKVLTKRIHRVSISRNQQSEMGLMIIVCHCHLTFPSSVTLSSNVFKIWMILSDNNF